MVRYDQACTPCCSPQVHPTSQTNSPGGKLGCSPAEFGWPHHGHQMSDDKVSIYKVMTSLDSYPSIKSDDNPFDPVTFCPAAVTVSAVRDAANVLSYFATVVYPTGLRDVDGGLVDWTPTWKGSNTSSGNHEFDYRILQ